MLRFLCIHPSHPHSFCLPYVVFLSIRTTVKGNDPWGLMKREGLGAPVSLLTFTICDWQCVQNCLISAITVNYSQNKPGLPEAMTLYKKQKIQICMESTETSKSSGVIDFFPALATFWLLVIYQSHDSNQEKPARHRWRLRENMRPAANTRVFKSCVLINMIILALAYHPAFYLSVSKSAETADWNSTVPNKQSTRSVNFKLWR